ncbi:hydroxyacid dehydrogenase [Humibacillus xanthopallidus]|uniref:Phosphoglycerate dehydrogenase-like enzyme n=1 Tax=Humibacillus xanthopallidus TaxID=412689 RepID=A0A543HZV6_9MICO|nr:hydroxyacid dehydrogenase [Humibacillus xanthopallidus]TQM63775.1 phosphoglycerate dehydrogenase-like enzyme [Humibacillus xanthopallidus]
MTHTPSAALAMAADLAPRLLSAAAQSRLKSAYHVDTAQTIRDFSEEDEAALAGVEVLITGWGSPRIDAEVLAKLPKLKAILHAAGSVRGHVDPAVWDRGVAVTSAAQVNALPVAEYTLAMILLSAKEVFRAQQLYHSGGRVDTLEEFKEAGCYGRRVGLVGASSIGRRVLELLSPFDLEIWLHDPFVNQAEADRLGVRLANLDELLSSCSVISLHAPLLDSTYHMIDARRIDLVRQGATLINTARGGLVDHEALVTALVSGRFRAVLDTTDPQEPLPADSPLLHLDNVFATPHVAGALGNELFRLGDHAVDNAVRLAEGRELIGLVTAAQLQTMA